MFKSCTSAATTLQHTRSPPARDLPIYLSARSMSLTLWIHATRLPFFIAFISVLSFVGPKTVLLLRFLLLHSFSFFPTIPRQRPKLSTDTLSKCDIYLYIHVYLYQKIASAIYSTFAPMELRFIQAAAALFGSPNERRVLGEHHVVLHFAQSARPTPTHICLGTRLRRRWVTHPYKGITQIRLEVAESRQHYSY
jgi:hypothetical protein